MPKKRRTDKTPKRLPDIEDLKLLNASIESMINGIIGNFKPPDTIHHYTDVNGLYAMLSASTIRLSHLYYLNDSKEYDYGLSLADEMIKKYINDAYSQSGNKSLETYFDLRHKFPTGSYCVACFSGEGDKLSQWRAYAGNGAGYIRPPAKVHGYAV